MCQESFKNVSMEFHWCFKELSRLFQGSKGVSRNFKWCFEEVSRKIEGCFEGGLRVFQESFKKVQGCLKKV